jgi:squalene synthase HpnC
VSTSIFDAIHKEHLMAPHTLSPSPADDNHLVEVAESSAVLAQAADENFPVASWVLPRQARSHLMAIYGFARLTDDLGDEASGDRMAHLDWLEGEVKVAADGGASHPLLRNLGKTITACDLPLRPFFDLIEANRQDQTVTRYAHFEDLVRYCELSATPIGRLVLYVFGAHTPERCVRSDDICIALQVIEHLQDVGEDMDRGRVYLPQADLHAYGCGDDDLRQTHASPSLRRLISFEAARARRLLGAGAPLAASLQSRASLAICGFTGGGMAALDGLRAVDYDVLSNRCRPSRARLALRTMQVLARSLSERRAQ